MFVRGGVYRVVKEALGGTLAKISVSALMFDYILTGPISGVSAGQYIAGLINEVLLTADTHGWIPARSALHVSGHSAFQRKQRIGGFRLGCDCLLLVAEHEGHPGVERESPAGNADHNRDGGDPADMVRDHTGEERLPACSIPDTRQLEVQR